MKKLIALSGAFFLSYVMMMSLIAPAAEQAPPVPAAATETAAGESAAYMLKNDGGKVAVFFGEALYLKTDTPVASLPKSDQLRLNEGIRLSTKEELKKVMEDLCS